MKNNRFKIKSLIAVMAATAIIASNGLFTKNINAATIETKENNACYSEDKSNYNLANTTQDGVILHAWNWSFNTIKDHLPDIAEAGYTSVQVSPIQGTKEPGKSTSQWWLLYQPTNFKIGNAQIGTRDEFKQLCNEAKKYGIKVIVDVVANHTANSAASQYYADSSVDPDLRNNENCWHEHRGVDNYNDRYQVTHYGIGLPDLNTSNPVVQGKVIDFLNDCVDCGADGFRFDAAKHIELPDESNGSDFWSHVLNSVKNKDNLFLYGEVLQGGADKFKDYANYMNVTASSYGYNVRKAVGYNSDKNVDYARDYCSDGVDASHLVTWVESHDNYAGNDFKSDSTNLNDWQIKMGWALIASRANSVPLFFDRPTSTTSNMGQVGKDNWEDKDIVAVNKFHNKMAGESEYIREQSKYVTMIERGSKGAVIVNLDNSTDLNSDTNLPDGTYVNQATTGGKFTVSNGRITGKLSSGITVLYAQDNEPKVSISKDGGNFTDELSLTLEAENCNKPVYSINNGEEKEYKNGDMITIGKDANNGDKITVTLRPFKGDKKGEKTYTFIKVENLSSEIYCKAPDGFSDLNVYVYSKSNGKTKELSAWPGVKMESMGDGLYKYTLKDFDDQAYVIFNDGKNQFPATGQEGYKIESGSSMIYEDGEWKNYSDEKEETFKVYCEKPNGWNDVRAYVYDDTEDNVKELSAWPGMQMKKSDNNLYVLQLDKKWSNAKIIFTDGSNQFPAANEPGYKLNAENTMIFKDGNWSKFDM